MLRNQLMKKMKLSNICTDSLLLENSYWSAIVFFRSDVMIQNVHISRKWLLTCFVTSQTPARWNASWLSPQNHPVSPSLGNSRKLLKSCFQVNEVNTKHIIKLHRGILLLRALRPFRYFTVTLVRFRNPILAVRHRTPLTIHNLIFTID